MPNPNPTAAREARAKLAELAKDSPVHCQITAAALRVSQEIDRQFEFARTTRGDFADAVVINRNSLTRRLSKGTLTLWDLLALRRAMGVSLASIAKIAEEALAFETKDAENPMPGTIPWHNTANADYAGDLPVDPTGAHSDPDLKALGAALGLDLK